MVESFPPSGGNYIKAIEHKHLKARFAQDELLIEIYVHKLQTLVLQQDTNDDNISLSNLFDKLDTQLRELEPLGVASGKYAAMLYLLVQSALPEEVTKAWERSCTSQSWSGVDQSNYLKVPLDFLKQEVESEERLLLACTTFGSGGRMTMTQTCEEKLPTAAVIFSGLAKKGERTYIWCDRGSHNSQECFTVRNLKFHEKKEILKRKGGCFHCLKPGHNYKKYRALVKCLFCGKKHHTIMCRDLSP